MQKRRASVVKTMTNGIMALFKANGTVSRTQWRDFVAAVSAVQSSVNYSTVRHLQFATMFFNSAWARASEHLKQALNAPGAYTRYSGFGVRNLRA